MCSACPRPRARVAFTPSAATVAVLPEAEVTDVEIDPNDLEIDVFRLGGPGGQSVNTTDSAVRITHKPTGLVVQCQDERSQLQNRDRAMQILRSRLLQLEQEKRRRRAVPTCRDQVKGGGRSEKIRTYNFKDNRATDHRVGKTVHSLDRFLQGEVDEVIERAGGRRADPPARRGMSPGRERRRCTQVRRGPFIADGERGWRSPPRVRLQAGTRRGPRWPSVA